MDKLAQEIPSLGRIELAREPDFTVGALRVRPSRREVHAGGARHVLQRRVMQVLVALAKSTNEVVPQNELVQRCWGGLSISDDAIGRCIAQLRRVSESWSEPPFKIETIAGVGYRLEASTGGRETAPPERRLRVGPRIAMVTLAGLAAVAAVTWAAIVLLVKPPPLVTPVVEIRAMSVIGDDPALKTFAARAADSIAGFLGDSEVRVISRLSPPAAGPARAPLAFDGAVSSDAGQLRLRLTLEDTRSGTTLWSRDFTGPASRGDALIGEAEGGAMETMNEMRPIYGPSGPLLGPETTMLALRGAEAMLMPAAFEHPEGVRQYEEALARRPDSGVLRGAYAAALVFAGLTGPPADRAGLFNRARAEAERTIREHPADAGGAYWSVLTIDQAEAPGDWIGAESRVDADLLKLPDDPFLIAYKCSLLVSLGRANDSLYFCHRALALRPHTAQFLLNYAYALDLQGYRPGFADQALEEGARLYPNFQPLRIYRFARETFAGSPDKAIALAHDHDTSPPITPEDLAATDLLEKARKSGAPADADAAMAAMKQVSEHDRVSEFRVLFPMALGRMDEAFGPNVAPVTEQEPELLWFAFTGRLRRDARYWPLAARAGFVRYWLTTNKWPDFCSDPTYPLDCRKEARRVAAAKS